MVLVTNTISTKCTGSVQICVTSFLENAVWKSRIETRSSEGVGRNQALLEALLLADEYRRCLCSQVVLRRLLPH